MAVGIASFEGALLDGRYRVDALTGSGTTTFVYKGTDERVGRPVAIKVPRPELRADERDGIRLQAEARAARAVSSDHIVRYLDAGNHIADSRAVPFLVMEWIDHVALPEAIVRYDEVPLDVASSWIAGLATALEAMHNKSLFHRDLRAANLLVAEDGRLVLGDFGSALFEGGARATVPPARAAARMTATAPEVMLGKEHTARSDIYAAGVAMYQILAGRSPFSNSDPGAAMRAAIQGDFEPLKSRRTDIPEELAELVEQCMSAEPGARPADGAELARMLGEVLVADGPDGGAEAEQVASGPDPSEIENLVATRLARYNPPGPAASSNEEQSASEPPVRTNIPSPEPVSENDPSPVGEVSVPQPGPVSATKSRLGRFLRVARLADEERGSEIARRVEDILTTLRVPFRHLRTDPDGNDAWAISADVGRVRVHTDLARGTVSFYQSLHEISEETVRNDPSYVLRLLQLNATAVSASFVCMPDSAESLRIGVLARLAATHLEANEVELALESLFHFSAMYEEERR